MRGREGVGGCMRHRALEDGVDAVVLVIDCDTEGEGREKGRGGERGMK